MTIDDLVVNVAIVAHEGGATDEGHYTTLVKKATFWKSLIAADRIKDWYKFDDDIVSVFSNKKLSELNGGGMHSLFRESSALMDLRIAGDDPSAYILLYKSRPLR